MLQKKKKQTKAIVAFNYNCFYKVCPDPSCHFEQEEKDVMNSTEILMSFLIYQTVTTDFVIGSTFSPFYWVVLYIFNIFGVLFLQEKVFGKAVQDTV